MTERPILFTGELVRAILEDRKTRTRRPMKVQPSWFVQHPGAYFDCYCGEKKTQLNPRGMGLHWCWWTSDDRQGSDWIRCPFGVPGDQLWVRETWRPVERVIDAVDGVQFLADDTFVPIANTHEAAEAWVVARGSRFNDGMRWRPSIHLPRWASRIDLLITDIRVERLQDITEEESKQEGIELKENDCQTCPWSHEDVDPDEEPYRAAFAASWDCIYGKKHPWASNSWVWNIAFKRLERIV